MNNLFLAAGGGSPITMFGAILPLVAIFAVLYLVMVLPQKRKEKKLQEQLKKMQIGDSVMSIGGIVGKVVNISGDEITIATSVTNTHITFKRNAINSIVTPEGKTVSAPTTEDIQVEK